MLDPRKTLKRLVREWAAIAHDREPGRVFLELGAQFDRWQHGEITAADRNDRIHQFTMRVSRDLERYAIESS